jgi:hypothetical protein
MRSRTGEILESEPCASSSRRPSDSKLTGEMVFGGGHVGARFVRDRVKGEESGVQLPGSAGSEIDERSFQ